MLTQEIGARIVASLQKAGHIAYFAGGWVRDFLLKVPSDDIDIATSASVEEVMALFPKTIPVGIAFGIVIVVMEGHSFEVATFRKEKEYVDGRRPTHIEPTTPEQDALRRDFTINGLFYDPIALTLFDYVKGQEDLEKGIIRAIGDPHHRFLEDRLRMIRAVRYSNRFQFPIEIDTKEAILYHAKSLFPSVAIERVWQELYKMSSSPHFAEGLVSLHKLELLPVIFPALKDVSSKEIENRLLPLYQLPVETPLIAKILFLFPDSSLEKDLELSEYLKLSKQEKEIVRFIHFSKNLLSMPVDWQKNVEPCVWAHFYANPLSGLTLQIYFFSQSDTAGFVEFHEFMQKKLSSYVQRIQKKDPVLRSQDLQLEGIEPGVRMGLLLKEAERLSINLGIEDKEPLMQILKNQSLWNEREKK